MRKIVTTLTLAVYSGQHNKGDDSFSFHKSKASSDNEDKRELGEEAQGVSPLSMGRFKPGNASEVKKFEWLNEIDIEGTYDKEELLAAPTDQSFPCIVCNNHRNIHTSTWAPAFLHKSSGTTWDIFNVDFDQTLHKSIGPVMTALRICGAYILNTLMLNLYRPTKHFAPTAHPTNAMGAR
jgi:hypothetical protein